jgi:hypothetical protein
MEISIDAPYIKERFETTRQHSILHPERIVGTPEVIPRNVGKSEHCRKAILSNIRHGASCAGPASGKRSKTCQF